MLRNEFGNIHKSKYGDVPTFILELQNSHPETSTSHNITEIGEELDHP